MASISTAKDGTRRLLFTGADGKRRTMRLGRSGKRDADRQCDKVTALELAAKHGHALDPETTAWAAALPDPKHSLFAVAGLLVPRVSRRGQLLGQFMETYIASRVDVKPATKEIWRQGEKGLLDSIGATAALEK